MGFGVGNIVSAMMGNPIVNAVVWTYETGEWAARLGCDVLRGVRAQACALPSYLRVLYRQKKQAPLEDREQFVFVDHHTLGDEQEARQQKSRIKRSASVLPMWRRVGYVLCTNVLRIGFLNLVAAQLDYYADNWNQPNVAAQLIATGFWSASWLVWLAIIPDIIEFNGRMALLSKRHSADTFELLKKSNLAWVPPATETLTLARGITTEISACATFVLQMTLTNASSASPLSFVAGVCYVLYTSEQFCEYTLSQRLAEPQRMAFYANNRGFIISWIVPPMVLVGMFGYLMPDLIFTPGVAIYLIDLLSIFSLGLSNQVMPAWVDWDRQIHPNKQDWWARLRESMHGVVDGIGPYVVAAVKAIHDTYVKLHDIKEPRFLRSIEQLLRRLERWARTPLLPHVIRQIDARLSQVSVLTLLPGSFKNPAALAKDPVIEDLVVEYIELLLDIIDGLKTTKDSAMGRLLVFFPRGGALLLSILYSLPEEQGERLLKALGTEGELEALGQIERRLNEILQAVQDERGKVTMHRSDNYLQELHEALDFDGTTQHHC